MIRRRGTRSGFTLVELLVVIAIIGVMVGLLLPAVQAAREAARRMSCSNNMKQIGLGMHNYHDSLRSFPLGSYNLRETWPASGSNWRALLLPYIEQSPLYDQLQFTATSSFMAGGAAGANALLGNEVLRELLIPTYRCPSSAIPEFEVAAGFEQSGADAEYQLCRYSGGCSAASRPRSESWNRRPRPRLVV